MTALGIYALFILPMLILLAAVIGLKLNDRSLRSSHDLETATTAKPRR